MIINSIIDPGALGRYAKRNSPNKYSNQQNRHAVLLEEAKYQMGGPGFIQPNSSKLDSRGQVTYQDLQHRKDVSPR